MNSFIDCVCRAVCEVMVWHSLKKFCDDSYPEMKFKTDEARKKYVIKKGLKVQKDEHGREGVAMAKDGADDTKEIRVGKRLSASKLKRFSYGEDADRNEMAAQHLKNSSNLKVAVNTKDCVSFCLIPPKPAAVWCGTGDFFCRLEAADGFPCLNRCPCYVVRFSMVGSVLGQYESQFYLFTIQF